MMENKMVACALLCYIYVIKILNHILGSRLFLVSRFNNSVISKAYNDIMRSGGTGIAGFVMKSGKAGCVSRVYYV